MQGSTEHGTEPGSGATRLPMGAVAPEDPAETVALVAAARREQLLRAHRHRLRPMIAGLRIDTSHDGTDLGPNRGQDGPRWRIYPGVPGWARWSVRHPPGL